MFVIFQVQQQNAASLSASPIRSIIDSVRQGTIGQKEAIRAFFQESDKLDAGAMRQAFRQIWKETVESKKPMDDVEKELIAKLLFGAIEYERGRNGGRIREHSLGQIAQWQLPKFATVGNVDRVAAEQAKLYQDIKGNAGMVENFLNGAVKALAEYGVNWDAQNMKFESKPAALGNAWSNPSHVQINYSVENRQNNNATMQPNYVQRQAHEERNEMKAPLLDPNIANRAKNKWKQGVQTEAPVLQEKDGMAKPSEEKVQAEGKTECVELHPLEQAQQILQKYDFRPAKASQKPESKNYEIEIPEFGTRGKKEKTVATKRGAGKESKPGKKPESGTAGDSKKGRGERRLKGKKLPGHKDEKKNGQSERHSQKDKAKTEGKTRKDEKLKKEIKNERKTRRQANGGKKNEEKMKKETSEKNETRKEKRKLQYNEERLRKKNKLEREKKKTEKQMNGNEKRKRGRKEKTNYPASNEKKKSKNKTGRLDELMNVAAKKKAGKKKADKKKKKARQTLPSLLFPGKAVSEAKKRKMKFWEVRKRKSR